MVIQMRRKDREIKEFDEIIDVFSRSKVLHLALISNGKPYAVPVNYGFVVRESDGQKKLSIYIHGAGEGKKLDAIKANPQVSFCAETSVEASGSNASEDACKWTCFYESVIGFGTASLVEDSKERTAGLDSIMFHNGYKIPFGIKTIAYSAMALAHTAVIKIEVSEITGTRHLK